MSAKERKYEAWKKIEPKLQVADIILVRERRPISKIIRIGTDSYWSHSMLVLFVPDRKRLFRNMLVVSAETHGIEVHRIQRYSKRFDHIYDIGVKRIPGLSEEVREKVLSYMFNNVDIPYDYTRLLAFFLNYVFNIFRGKKKRSEHLKNFLVNKDAFICSSFIQKAFFEAVPKNRKDSVIFGRGEDAKYFLEEVTPADIARSKKCEWVYNEHD